MRRLLLPTATMILLAGCSLAAAQPPAVVPPNGGFEQFDAKTGQPTGWAMWHPERNLTTYTLAMAHSGVGSACVTDDNATDSQGLRSPRVPIAAGKTYVASGYVWITELKVGSFALYLEYWRGDNRLANYSVSTNEIGKWAELKIQQPAPADATEATVLIYAGSSSIGQAFFDDVSLAAVGP